MLMPRLPQLVTISATPEQQELLDLTRRQLGRVPNLYAAMAGGPAALRGYLALRDALVAGVLDSALRERLALLIAQDNRCTYCVSAHTMRMSKLGLDADEALRARAGESADPHAAAVLKVAAELLEARGRIGDDDLASARAAGVTDAELAEVVAHIALNTLSNYFNHLAEPELDFPEVALVLPVSG
jgi:uncharacterized peroxidase-related enzyme